MFSRMPMLLAYVAVASGFFSLGVVSLTVYLFITGRATPPHIVAFVLIVSFTVFMACVGGICRHIERTKGGVL